MIGITEQRLRGRRLARDPRESCSEGPKAGPAPPPKLLPPNEKQGPLTSQRTGLSAMDSGTATRDPVRPVSGLGCPRDFLPRLVSFRLQTRPRAPRMRSHRNEWRVEAGDSEGRVPGSRSCQGHTQGSGRPGSRVQPLPKTCTHPVGQVGWAEASRRTKSLCFRAVPPSGSHMGRACGWEWGKRLSGTLSRAQSGLRWTRSGRPQSYSPSGLRNTSCVRGSAPSRKVGGPSPSLALGPEPAIKPITPMDTTYPNL